MSRSHQSSAMTWFRCQYCNSFLESIQLLRVHGKTKHFDKYLKWLESRQTKCNNNNNGEPEKCSTVEPPKTVQSQLNRSSSPSSAQSDHRTKIISPVPNSPPSLHEDPLDVSTVDNIIDIQEDEDGEENGPEMEVNNCVDEQQQQLQLIQVKIYPDLSPHISRQIFKGQELFVCNICKTIFPDLFNIEEHVMTHHDEIQENPSSSAAAPVIPTQDPVASQRDTSQSSKNDLTTIKPNKKIFKCHVCTRKFISSSERTVHGLRSHGRMVKRDKINSGRHHVNQITESTKRIKESKSRGRPFKPMTPPSRPPKANDKENDTESSGSLSRVSGDRRRHWFQTRNRPPRLADSDSSKYVIRREVGDQNVKENGNLFPYVCQICDREYRFYSQALRHIPSHTRERNFKCCFCEETFMYQNMLRGHELQVHLFKTCTDAVPNSLSNSAPTSSTREIKRLGHYSGRKNLDKIPQEQQQSIENTAETVPKVPKGNSKNPLEIPALTFHGLLTVEEAKLSPHITWKKGLLYTCNFCGQTLRTASNAVIHTRIHTNEKPYKCLFCDKKFGDPSGYRRHMKSHQSRDSDVARQSSSSTAAVSEVGKMQNNDMKKLTRVRKT